jgi:uncharacterized protein (DUF697 family)
MDDNSGVQGNSTNSKINSALEALIKARGASMQVQELKNILTQHAIGAAAATVTVAWVPVAGVAAWIGILSAVVFSMFYRINKQLGVSLSKKLIKSIAASIISSLSGAVVGLTVAGATLAFVPVLGSIGSSILLAAMAYALSNVAGYIYIKLMTSLSLSGTDLSSITEEHLKDLANEMIKNEDIGQMVKDAQEEYKAAKKAGTISGEEKIDLVNAEDEEDSKDTGSAIVN